MLTHSLWLYPAIVVLIVLFVVVQASIALWATRQIYGHFKIHPRLVLGVIGIVATSVAIVKREEAVIPFFHWLIQNPELGVLFVTGILILFFEMLFLLIEIFFVTLRWYRGKT